MDDLDRDFNEIRFNGIDAWDCWIQFDFPHMNTCHFAIHIWADESGPTEAQRNKLRTLLSQYDALWPVIASRIVDVHDRIETPEEVASTMPEHLGLHLGEHFEDSAELVIHLNLADEGYRGYFIMIDDMSVGPAIVAD